MKQKNIPGKRVALWLMCLLTVLGIVNLPVNTTTVKAEEYKYSDTVTGEVDMYMDEIVYCVGNDGYYPGIAEIVTGSMPKGLTFEVDDCGNVHFIGTPEEAGTFEISFYVEEYDGGYLYQGGFERTIVIDEIPGYGVKIGGKEFNFKRLTIQCGKGTATYDPYTQTLTLDGAEISVPGESAIYTDSDLVIKVVGDNVISESRCAISNQIGELTICGDGSLRITTRFGIALNIGNIYITDKVKVDFDSCAGAISTLSNVEIMDDAKLSIVSSVPNSKAISIDKDVKISGNSDVTIDVNDIGILATNNIIISGSGTVDITATGEGIRSHRGSVTLANSGIVKINSSKIGIDSYNTMTFSGSGEVSITSKQEGIMVINTDSMILFNGTGPISIHSGDKYNTVYHYFTAETVEILGGTNFDKYKILGSLATNYVEFRYEDEKLPEITKQPENITVEVGATAVFRVTATGEGLTYAWEISRDGGNKWEAIAGITNTRSINSVTAIMDGWMFRVKVTDKNGKTVTSDAATLTVEAAGPVITKDLEDVSVAVGEKAIFGVNVTGEGLTYAWEKSADGGTKWAPMAGTTGTRSISSVTANMNGWKFRVTATDKNGKSVTSRAATLTVRTTVAAGPVITKNLENVSVAVGEKAILTVNTTGDGLTYAWEKSANGGTTWAAMAGTTNSRSITATASMNGWKFRVKITDKNGNTVTSAAVTMTVGGPVITQQLKNLTVAAGAKATFSVIATGEVLTYRWEKSTNGGRTWVAMAGTTNTRSINSVAASYNGWKFRVIITDKKGRSVTSNAATLTVK